MRKESVFQQWLLRNKGRVAAPFSVGGGGALLGPKSAPNALEDLVSNLKRKYGTRAPKAVASTEEALRATVGPSFQNVPRGRVQLGRRDANGVLVDRAIPVGGVGGAPKQLVSVSNPATPAGRATAHHEAGHLEDPLLRGTGLLNYNNGQTLRAERAATQTALRRIGTDSAVNDPTGLFQGYGTYLQGKFPLPEEIQAHMRANPINTRAQAVANKYNNAAEELATLQRSAYKDYHSALSNQERAAQQDFFARKDNLTSAVKKVLASRNQSLPAHVTADQVAEFFLQKRLARQKFDGGSKANQTLRRLKARGDAALRKNPRVKELQSADKNQSMAKRIGWRNQNDMAQELQQLRTLPENLRPQMQEWFDAQRRRIDLAFGEGSGDRALAPILEHIGWGA